MLWRAGSEGDAMRCVSLAYDSVIWSTWDPGVAHVNDTYQRLADEIVAAVAGAASAELAMREVVTRLQRRLPHYAWAGFYLLEGHELVLGPYVGKPSPHTRIPLGRGICGAAATTGQSIIVDDVNSDPRYLACSIETKSEIVVPILHAGKVLGEIDIDSDRPAAFGPEDRTLLETIAGAIAPRLPGTKETVI